MDELISNWCNKYGFQAGKVSGYRGGYPIVEFTVKNEHGVYNLGQKGLDKFVRKAELSAGSDIGVGFNFRKTAFIIWNNNSLIICGHSSVIDRVLQNVFHR